MGDAYTHATRHDREITAERHLAEAVVVFLEEDQTEKSLTALEAAITTASETLRINVEDAKRKFLKLQEHEREDWKVFYNSSLFNWGNVDVQERLLKIAEKRKIGESKWVI